MSLKACLCALVLLLGTATQAGAAQQPASIHYHIELVPDKRQARVRIELEQAAWVEYARFNTEGYALTSVKATGALDEEGKVLVWRPQADKATLSYTVDIPRQRRSGGYDAYITKDWALLRGERLVPPIRVWRPEGAQTEVSVTYYLPEDWSINTGWPRLRGNRFRINNPDFIFPRPAGWIVAGDLNTRQETLPDGTLLIVSAPKGQNFRPLELLGFVSMIWPEVHKAFPDKPQKILITGAGNPMWRGGLSAPNSYYIHSDRPLISANGTSTVVHELVHVVTGIRGKPMHNWIAEGVAEYYAIELLFRAGAYSAERKASLFKNLENWGKDVKTLRVKNSQGRVTARAAVLFHQLDLEIRQQTRGKHNLDHLIRHLMPTQVLDLDDLRNAYQTLYGKTSSVLQSPLLKEGPSLKENPSLKESPSVKESPLPRTQ